MNDESIGVKQNREALEIQIELAKGRKKKIEELRSAGYDVARALVSAIALLDYIPFNSLVTHFRIGERGIDYDRSERELQKTLDDIKIVNNKYSDSFWFQD